MKYYTVPTNKRACDICGEKKPGCRVVWEKLGWSCSDDAIVGTTCKKDISAFAKKHNITEYL